MILYGWGAEKDRSMQLSFKGLALNAVAKLTLAGVCGWALLGAAASGQSLEDRLDQVLDGISGDVPGAILSVSSAEFEYDAAIGLSDRSTDASMRTDHTLRLGSVTKTYMAVLALMAEDEGLIALDAPIDRYLDASVMGQLPAGLTPTVRQLLNHTSGVPDYYGVRFYLWDWRDRGALTPQRVLHAIRGKAASNAPGERFAYSNTNYHLLALILEDVFARDLETLLQTRIFDPLDLQRTYYSQMFAPGDDVHGYGGAILPWVDTYHWQENTGPDGGMFASVEDVQVWIRALFSPDGAFQSYGARMMADPARQSARVEQGMGVEILTSRSGVRFVGHTGSVDGYAVAAFYAPETDKVMVFFTNTTHGEGFMTGFTGVLRALQTP